MTRRDRGCPQVTAGSSIDVGAGWEDDDVIQPEPSHVQADAPTEPDQPALMPEPARAARETARSARTKSEASRKKTSKQTVEPAAVDPVAQVLVDVPLAHLDRPFDYLVPEKMSAIAVPGSRVKVRFAGQDVDGFVLARVEESSHQGRLAPLRRAVSPEPVLSPAVAALSASVAARYAGTRSDVLRLAVPARHATVEKEPSAPAPAADVDVAAAEKAWSLYTGGTAFVRHLADGGDPRAVWAAAPGEEWPVLLAQAAAATYSSGRGVLLCVPDYRDVERVDAALRAVLGEGHHVVLAADLGPAERYRSFLAVSRGARRVVVGTRAAAFAPVHDLGLVALWDDGDDLYADPHAPYPHTREVLLLRAHEESCAALVGGFARTGEAEFLLRTGWAKEIAAPREVIRDRAAHMGITGATDVDLARDPFARTGRLPRAAFDAIRAGLEQGPVLLQTPRHGYATSLSCDRCRAPARCRACAGPLRVSAAHLPPSCAWCGEEERSWSCTECGGRGLRAPVRGDRRTAEEIGRAFPSTPVRTSSGDRVLSTVPGSPAVVVATPGAEPVPEGGYPCVVLLDTWLMLARTDLRATEESLRRWMNAAALARPAGEGGRVVVVGESSEPVLQALLRWDAAGFAQRELADRQSAHLPPASRLATITGSSDAVTGVLGSLTLPDAAEVLGPVPVEERAGPKATADQQPPVRAVVRVPRARGAELSRALVEMQGVRDAKKLEPVRVQVDPVSLG
ncbi:MAG TPA: primosomal protein N' [Nocardioidaceae bacterium]|nr:primosomal protein N' [Nocardioidaceae bacterium]